MEKSLKAFIELKGTSADMSLLSLHKPRRLYEAACALGLAKLDKHLALQLTEFSEYYYDTNYPGDSYFELTEQTAKEALVIMRQVNSLVEIKLSARMDIFNGKILIFVCEGLVMFG